MQHGISEHGWIPSNVNSYMFTFYVLALAIKFKSGSKALLFMDSESSPGSTGLIFEVADEQYLQVPVPSRRINIQIVIQRERKQLNLK